MTQGTGSPDSLQIPMSRRTNSAEETARKAAAHRSMTMAPGSGARNGTPGYAVSSCMPARSGRYLMDGFLDGTLAVHGVPFLP